MWQVVYIASSKKEAENILNLLEKKGFMIQVENEGAANYQIKVPALEAEEAYSCLHEKF